MPQTRDVRGDETFDSRDTIARRDELREEREELADALKNLRDDEDNTEPEDRSGAIRDAEEAIRDWDEENAEELAALESFIENASGYGDFEHGTHCVRDDKFEDHAREVAGDLTDYDGRSERWPFTCIDWEKAAHDLQMDYTSADLDGTTYWFRS